MSDFASLFSSPAHKLFLGEEDLLLIRQDADEVDAAYGELLEPLMLAVLDRRAASISAA